MKSEIESAIKALAKRCEGDTVKPDEAMKLSQSALNLSHVLATLDNMKDRQPGPK